MFSMFMPRRTKAIHTASPKDDDDDLVLLETTSWGLGPHMTGKGAHSPQMGNRREKRLSLGLSADDTNADADTDALYDGAGAAVDWRPAISLTPVRLDLQPDVRVAERSRRLPVDHRRHRAGRSARRAVPAPGKALEVERRKDFFAKRVERCFCKWTRGRCKMLAAGLIAWLLLLLAAALIYFYANINDGLHISYGDTPTEMTVTWFTNTQLVPPTVVVRAVTTGPGPSTTPTTPITPTAPTTPTTVLPGPGARSGGGGGAHTLASVGRSDGYSKSFLQVQFVNRVTVAGLRPGTTYEFLYGEGATAAEFADPDSSGREVFRFHVPAEDQPFVTMAVLGDMGAFNMAALDYLQDDVDGGQLDLAFHLGDFAYDLDSFFGLVGDLFFSNLKPVAGMIPYMVTPGNHESYWDDFNQYMNRFTMPQHAATKNLWYSFEVGPVSVISISSEAFYTDLAAPLTEDDQMRWLEAELLQVNRTRTPWLVTMSHRPMYCSSDDPDCDRHIRNTVRSKLEDLLDHHNVSVAFWAHEHSYERTCPVYNGHCTDVKGQDEGFYIKPDHPIHVITGAAGSVEGFDEFDRGSSEWTRSQDRHWGFGRMKANRSSFVWTQRHIIDGTLTTVDRFEIRQ